MGSGTSYYSESYTNNLSIVPQNGSTTFDMLISKTLMKLKTSRGRVGRCESMCTYDYLRVIHVLNTLQGHSLLLQFDRNAHSWRRGGWVYPDMAA
jgi:hypothetical protein